ncbi:RNA polymerase factor sigma-54 [Aquamicrobium zhengzhouense]|uniref:RNA polymerase sigma-54 factor n=1 Tax=Aquamicrobium zhengzhouense TaxID=2781738 RepID=A0ABS0SEZ5_9HYPH|nr:RNA polymerase factor sigma-54 [Aquamicrobium zhengzhouense]MBI1621858.1 RNA polymerase factor sigma-54 [Aquamicrobium zhengzhouense]
MGLSAKLQLRQSQSLVMTPQLMQSIRLLQFTHIELERFIDEEIEKNPLLERPEPVSDEPEMDVRSSLSEAEAADTSIDQMFEVAETSVETLADQLDTSMENVFPDDPAADAVHAPDRPQLSSASTASAGESYNLEEMARAEITLFDHVTEQIAFSLRHPSDLMIAHELADALDEAGYMRASVEEVAERLGTDVEDVCAVLEVCQRFDPPGLFARDLAECLALQLRSKDRLDPAMQAMLANLDLLARRDFVQLRRLCGVDDDDLIDMLAEIRGLDPRPALVFTYGTADPIVPDIIVKPAADGSWSVELNPDALPRVLVNQTYFASVSTRAKSTAEKEFLAECMQSANWLTRSLDQRAKTILKVASEIVRQQDAFLLHGVRHLRPLNLRTVADAIGMHESTVSRVTANKYMMTSRGLFELRYFFSVAIASAEGGDAHSSEAVRDRIRALIDAETAAEILSDDAIVAILNQDGIDIARRTVAKYREAMNIPSSVQRRREKRARAAVG